MAHICISHHISTGHCCPKYCQCLGEKYTNLNYVLGHSVISDSAIPWTVVCQAPPSMEFSRQEYWSGVPFLFPNLNWKVNKLIE